METSPGCKVVLHVGCGPKVPGSLHPRFGTGEWKEIRLDIDPAVQPDLIASIISMPEVPANTMDAVWSSHNIEHLFAHEVPLALGEFWRVLKPGGFALLAMPDLQRVAEVVAQGNLEPPLYISPEGPISAIDMLFGHRASIARGNHFMAHRTGFTASSLGQKLAAAGFCDIRVGRRDFELLAIAHKATVQES